MASPSSVASVISLMRHSPRSNSIASVNRPDAVTAGGLGEQLGGVVRFPSRGDAEGDQVGRLRR